MMKALKGPVVGLLLTAVFTWITYGMALQIQAGEEVRTSGRRGLYKMAFAWLAETLGSKGVLAIGIVLGVLMVVWAVMAVKKAGQPPKPA